MNRPDNWRKSAYSGANGGGCGGAQAMTTALSSCRTRPTARAAFCRFSPGAWRKFTDGVKRWVTDPEPSL